MEKYSDKFLNQINKLKNSVIGIEFEFYLKDLSFYKTLEILNNEMKPVKVHGFRQYHSGFKTDRLNHKLEPDLSGGSNMCEYITGPMDYYDAKYYLIKIIKFIQNYGYTNEKCSIHFNISFKGDKNLNDLNVLKLILNTNEEEIYKYYPTRKDNVYAKSIKKIIPFKDYDFFNIPVDVVKNNLRLPNDKYYGINFLHINENKESQRLEMRYVGGKDYEKNLGQLIYFMERFIINTYDSIDSGFTSDDVMQLEEYLESNIKNYKNLAKYDNFIVDFPTVQLQINQDGDYNLVSAYYDKIFDKLFKLVESTENLKECIINYVTETQVMEIIDADFKASSTVSGFDMINCQIEGIFTDCLLSSCDIKNSQLTKSKIINSDITKTKVLNCKVESSLLVECYFMDGYLNADMQGGVFRSGQLGPYATMDSNVKIVDYAENFFDKKFDEDEKDKTIKGYGKK